MRRASTLVITLLGAASLAWGHYRWVYYTGREAPYQPIPLKFDLAALPDGVVQYFISREGPQALMPYDSPLALASQIRLAAETWNTAPGSALRLKFGGVADPAAQQAAPRIEVVFSDEIPPGVLAQTWPETESDLSFLAPQEEGKVSPGFAPILRSRLMLRSDLTASQQASFSDDFFLTMVHEFGHSLGLQHSMTSAVMATAITRGTSKSRPLAADDIAGISTLYPTPSFLASTGVISGKVSAGGEPLNLASVVALSADGTAIGGMTQPDGTYRIEGLPPGEYRVYAHPLPPAQFGEALAAGIVPPYDLAGVPFPASAGFATQFFPDTQEWTAASLVAVAAGATVADVNFNLPLRDAPGIYNMRTFAYLGEPGPVTPVQSPPLVSGDRRWLVFQAPGALVPGTTELAPGLRLSVIGGPALVEQSSLQYWPGTDGFLLIVASAAPEVKHTTPIALAANTDTDLYVLPAAFSVVPSPHPQITSVTGTSDAAGQEFGVIQGVNLGADTRIFFDGTPALSVTVNEDGTLTAAAPPAVAEHHSVIEAVGPNGQTSWQVLGAQPLPMFTYQAAQLPSIQVSPGFLTAGTSAMVRIDGTFTNFIEGRTSVGFGSSDIAVRQTWVLSPTSLLINVSVSPKATPGIVQATVATGLQMITAQTVVEIHAADFALPSIRVPMINPDTGFSAAPAGGRFLMEAAGLPEDTAGWSVKVGGLDAMFVRTEDGRLLVEVPVSVALGPQMVELTAPDGGAAPPVLFQIDAQPPRILALVDKDYFLPDSLHPILEGERVAILVAGLGEIGQTVVPESLEIRLNGFRLTASKVIEGPDSIRWVEFVLPEGSASLEYAQQLRIGQGTRVSPAWLVTVNSKPEPEPPPETEAPLVAGGAAR
jgi:hypothetical protein